MQMICELMRLHPDRVQDYRDMHEHTWAELIVIMKCEDFEDSVRRLSATPVYQRWTREVRAMLVEDRELFATSEKIVDLEPIWDLSKL